MSTRYTQDELVAFVQIWQTSTCMNQALERILACDVHRNPSSTSWSSEESYMRGRASFLRSKGIKLKRLPSSLKKAVDYGELRAIAASPLNKPCKC